MSRISYRGYRFPPDIIQRAVWLYFRFSLSFRDVEDLLAERGIEVSYETIRQWATRFGPAIARDLRSRRPRHMDSGIWARCSSRLAESGCICGELSMPKARFLTAWSSPAGTNELPRNHAQASEEAGLCSKPSRHRSSQVLPRGFPRDGAHRRSPPREEDEQPG